MAKCAKCNSKVGPGMTRCPDSGCNASLMRTGIFTELFGWVVAVVSSIPVAVAVKTVNQGFYPPLIFAGVVFGIGLVFVVLGRSKSRSAQACVVEEDAPEGGTPAEPVAG
jgi:hypothetical protein